MPPIAKAPAAPSSRSTVSSLVLGLVALVALALSAVVPVAPVAVNHPVVTWPAAGSGYQSTSLMLSSFAPVAVTVDGTCEVAAEATDGPLLETVPAAAAAERALGLDLRVDDGALAVRSGDGALDPYPLGSSCSFTVRHDADGLELSVDGERVAAEPGAALPQIDALATSLDASSPAGLAVRVDVDDRFASSTTPLKTALCVLALLAAVAAGVLLHRAERGTVTDRRPGERPRLVTVSDVVVAATLVWWTFVAPNTDDDGYYAAMARNSDDAGYVGNYYQMYNQSFTPFTWVWYALGAWQRLGGDGVVWQRIPVLVAGLATWYVVRRFTERAGAGLFPTRRWVVRAVVTVVFLAWWLPYGMGIRPETIAGLGATVTLALVARAIERERLVPLQVAVGVASVSLAVHPTGAVAFAPLVLALPWAWRTAARSGTWGRLARAAAVASGGAVAVVAAFADSSLHDYLAGQARFAAIEEPLTWADEWRRYDLLMSWDPQGNYAKRVIVLVTLVALLWALAAIVVTRIRRTTDALPARTYLAVGSFALALILLWITPSKWSHHFGALAGLGTVVLALVVLGLPGFCRRWLPGDVARRVGLATTFSFVPAIAVGFDAPNIWAYNWMIGAPQVWEAPHVGPLTPSSLAQTALFAVIVATVCWYVGRRRDEPASTTVAPAIVTTVALLGSIGFTVGSQTLATARTLDSWSPTASNLEDPSGTQCVASDGIAVQDTRAGALAPAAAGEAELSRFVADGGVPPQITAPTSASGAIPFWGSFDVEGDGAGTLTTPWYAIGEPEDGPLSALLAGSAETPMSISFDYGTLGPDGAVEIVDTSRREPGIGADEWRPVDLLGDAPEGADVVRVRAVDGAVDDTQWMAMSAPVRAVPRSLTAVAGDAPVVTAWQIAALFPCLDQPSIADGIIERPDLVVSWAGSRYGDAIFRTERGGIGAQGTRGATSTLLASRIAEHPVVPWGDVHALDYGRLAPDAYDLRVETVVTNGLTSPVDVP